MVFWLSRIGLGWFCFGVSCFDVWLDSTGTQAFSLFVLSLVGLLFWFQRNLHAGAGPALARPGFFTIRPVGRLTAIRKSKTRPLSSCFIRACVSPHYWTSVGPLLLAADEVRNSY